MQSVSSRIWTRVAVSISYDDNHCTTDYWWSIKKDLDNIEHDRQTRKKIFTIVLMFTKILFLLLVY